jgi:hypothetical protein
MDPLAGAQSGAGQRSATQSDPLSMMPDILETHLQMLGRQSGKVEHGMGDAHKTALSRQSWGGEPAPTPVSAQGPAPVPAQGQAPPLRLPIGDTRKTAMDIRQQANDAFDAMEKF